MGICCLYAASLVPRSHDDPIAIDQRCHHDLRQEITRAQIDERSGISALVEYIQRETDAALRLLEKEPPAIRR
jgi:hypothetical protein